MPRVRALSILLAAVLTLGQAGVAPAWGEEPMPTPTVATAEPSSPDAASPAAEPEPVAPSQPEPVEPEPIEPEPTPTVEPQPSGSPVPEPTGEPTPSDESDEPAPDPQATGTRSDEPEPADSEPATTQPTKSNANARSQPAAVIGEVGSGVRSHVLTKGHIDLFEVTYADGGLKLSVKDDTNLYSGGAQYRSPAEVSVWVDTAGAALQIPDAPDYRFLGNPGDTVYHLPFTQDQNLPWPGWSTERLVGSLPSGVLLPTGSDAVKLAVQATGPGDVFTWMTGAFGGVTNRYVDTTDEVADVIPISRNAHVHTAWAFTRPGDYYLTITPTATTTTGETLTGDAAVYHVRVGPAADAAPTAATRPSITGNTEIGATLTLHAGGWHPTPHQLGYQWLRDGEPIDGATSLSYTTVTADDGHLISARVTGWIGTAERSATADGVRIGEEEPQPDQEPTSVTLVAAGSVSFGQSVTLTATVTPRGGTVTEPLGVGGTVEFLAGSTKVGEAPITNLRTGQARLTVTPSALGANSYRARYLPPATHARSESDPVIVTVNPATTRVAVAAGLSEAALGQPVSVGAAVTPAWASGQLQILSGGTVIAEGGARDGRFQATVATLPVGVHQLTARFVSAVPEALDSVSLPTVAAPITVVAGAPRGAWSRTVADHEHVDVFSISLAGDQLELDTRIDLDHLSKTNLPKYGSNRERVQPQDVLFHLPDQVSTGLGTPGGRKTIPDNPHYAFLGQPGDTVWIAPATSDSTPFLYAGVDTESIEANALVDNRVDLHLVRVDAPEGGRFEAYSGALTPSSQPWRMLSSTDPAFASTPFATGSHVHFSWAFTRLGTYVLHVKAAARLADGTPVESEVKQFSWVVGDLTGAPQVSMDTTATQDSGRLTARVAPTSALGHVEFRDAAGTLLGHAPVRNGAAVLTEPLAAGSYTVTASYLPEALDRYRAASSAPATVVVDTPEPPELLPTTVTLIASTTTVTAGQSLTLTATVTPRGADGVGGMVEFYSGGTRVGQASIIDPNTGVVRLTVTPTSPGVHSYQARYLPPASHEKAESTPLHVTVNPDVGPRWDVPNGTRTDSGATILNIGHVDVASLLSGGKLVTKIKDTTESSTPIWRDPASVVLQVFPGAQTSVPANSAYSFLGAPGSATWLLPETQDASLLWPGWSTEEIAATATRTGFDWTLTGVDGPGAFALFTSGDFGMPKVRFNTRDGLPDTMSIDKRVHVHGSWAFSAEGVYCLAFNRATTLTNGTRVSDDFTLAVAVGKVDVQGAEPTSCGKQPGQPDPTPTPDPKPDPEPNPDPKPSPDPKPTKKPAEKSKAANQQCSAGATILSAGHIDYASRIVGGKLESLIGDDTSGKKVYREPSGVVLWLKPSAKVTLPSGMGQVGRAGATVWQVPQTQNRDLIWLGWNTELLNAGNAASPVTWKLDSVSGPGTVKVYLTGAFGGVQTMVLNGRGSNYQIPLGVHAHGNWAFSKEGTYRLKMTQTVTLPNGKRSSDTETLTIAVGDVDPAKAARSGSGCGTVSAAKLNATSGSEADQKSAEQAKAAEQAQADAAGQPDGGSGDVGSAAQPIPGGRGDQSGQPGESEGAPLAATGSPVPGLLAGLGGLLLVGAAGTAGLWWYRRRWAAPA